MDGYKLVALIILTNGIIAFALANAQPEKVATFSGTNNPFDAYNTPSDLIQNKTSDPYGITSESTQDPSTGGVSNPGFVNGLATLWDVLSGKTKDQATNAATAAGQGQIQFIAWALTIFWLILHIYGFMKLDAYIRRRDIT